MYFLNKTTTPLTFTRVQSGFNIYYLPRGNKGDIKAFPPGFKMIAGDNGRNTYNASLFSDQAISWVCLDYENSSVNGRETPGFPTTNCPNGIRGQVFFPSCWDGVNLDSANHKDHVSYPIQNYNGGECPSSHPVKLVSLFYEQIFDTGGFEMNSDGQTWVLANGDTTGYSMHADFQNGWDTSILQKVIDQCDEDSGNGNIRACQPLVPFIDEGARDACQLDSDIQIPDEHIGLFRGGALSTLLGNNPIWLPSLPKPSNLTYVESASWGRVGSLLEGVGTRGSHPPSFGTTDGTQIGDVNGADWEVRGCIGESKNGRRALEGSVITDQPEMNLRTCALLCESRGYSIAGVEFARSTAQRNMWYALPWKSCVLIKGSTI
ncbi:hypothetical protein FRC17_006113 [Serendipita sp. 399]|nr:hypothetical protein FRC17_006113 [Serendipita sp. 399]